MSLLSDLIAQLRALIDRNSETMSAGQSARDTIEATIAPLQAALNDSSNPTAHEGLAQLQAALEKLDEVQVLLQAGNTAMDSYITGPLLGGGNKSELGVNKVWNRIGQFGAAHKKSWGATEACGDHEGSSAVQRS